MAELGLVKFDPRLLLARVISTLADKWTSRDYERNIQELMELGNEVLHDSGELANLMREPEKFESTFRGFGNVINLGLEVLSVRSLDLACENFQKLGFRRLYEVGEKAIRERRERAQRLRQTEVKVENRTGRVKLLLLYEVVMEIGDQLDEISEGKFFQTEICTMEQLRQADQALQEIETKFSALQALPWEKLPTILVGPMTVDYNTQPVAMSRLLNSLAVDWQINGQFTKDILLIGRAELESFINKLFVFANGEKFDLTKLLAGKLTVVGQTATAEQLAEQLLNALGLVESQFLRELLIERCFTNLTDNLVMACSLSSEFVMDEDIPVGKLECFYRLAENFFIDLSAEEWPEIIAQEKNDQHEQLGSELADLSEDQVFALFRERPRFRLDLIEYYVRLNNPTMVYRMLLDSTIGASPAWCQDVVGWLENVGFKFSRQVLCLWEKAFRNDYNPKVDRAYLDGLVHSEALAKIIRVLPAVHREQVLADFRKLKAPKLPVKSNRKKALVAPRK